MIRPCLDIFCHLGQAIQLLCLQIVRHVRMLMIFVPFPLSELRIFLCAAISRKPRSAALFVNKIPASNTNVSVSGKGIFELVCELQVTSCCDALQPPFRCAPQADRVYFALPWPLLHLCIRKYVAHSFQHAPDALAVRICLRHVEDTRIM